IANNGNVFYFETNDKAPNSKVVRYDLDNPVCLLEVALIFRMLDLSQLFLSNHMQSSKMPLLQMKSIYFYDTCITCKTNSSSFLLNLWKTTSTAKSTQPPMVRFTLKRHPTTSWLMERLEMNGLVFPT